MNTPNVGGALPGFPEDLVVEVFARVDRAGIHPEAMPALPRHVRGLIGMLAEYQWLTAEAAWEGDRRDAIRALASPPVDDLDPDEPRRSTTRWRAAHRDYLPERLLR